MQSVGLGPAIDPEVSLGRTTAVAADGSVGWRGGDVRDSVDVDRGEPRGLVTRLIPLTAGGPTGWQAVVKRIGDIAVALLLLLLVLPVLIGAAILVRIDSPGPVLFRQQRVGRGGRLFVMYKFRTFPVEHVDVVQSLKVEDCPLRFGRVLRRTSIDELPQLLNVLKGDMSLVGPRPERPTFAESLAGDVPGYRERHRAPAGLTGNAQVLGLVGTTSIEDRVAADNAYIDGWSLRRDVALMFRTVPAVIRKFWQ